MYDTWVICITQAEKKVNQTMKTTIIITAAAVALGACAQSPEAIAPIAMGDIYGDKTCREASVLLQQEHTKLVGLEAQQRSAKDNDTVGVLLIGLPVSSMSGGDVAGEIGASKGKVQALTARLSNC